ncbi:MAG: hypothetical protein K6A79_08585 [Ruminococcus sp.]|jgi:hypothetical protein|nr:hypothetical protein [Ruminococcus sp.]
MSILELNRSGHRSEISNVMTERGMMTIENLTPDETNNEVLKAAENELYNIFSKYKKELDKIR